MAAGKKKAGVAEKLGVSHVVIVRFLTGTRTPSPANVLRISSAIAKLTDYPGVEDYLNLSASVCDLLHGEHFGDEPLAKGVTQCLRWYGHFFKPDAVVDIQKRISALGEVKKRKVVLRLCRALRSVVVSDLLPSSSTGFQAVFDALAESGINPEEVASEQCAAQLAWERFAQTVQHELQAQNPRIPARERRAATRRIIEAITVSALAAIEVSRDDALVEVKTTENGKQVSRFYGDARAAWLPFMSPKER